MPQIIVRQGYMPLGLNFSPWQWENIRTRCFFISSSCLKAVKKSFTTIWAIWGWPHSQSLPLCGGGGKRRYLASKKWSYLSNLPTEIRSDYRFGNYRLCPFICDQSQLCSSIISRVISWRRWKNGPKMAKMVKMPQKCAYNLTIIKWNWKNTWDLKSEN